MFPLSASVEKNIKKESMIDANFLPNDEALRKEVLELGLMEIKHEREFLSKRVAMVVGPGNDFNLLVMIYRQIVSDNFVMQFHRF